MFMYFCTDTELPQHRLQYQKLPTRIIGANSEVVLLSPQPKSVSRAKPDRRRNSYPSFRWKRGDGDSGNNSKGRCSWELFLKSSKLKQYTHEDNLATLLNCSHSRSSRTCFGIFV